jgi:hypothetical protein
MRAICLRLLVFTCPVVLGYSEALAAAPQTFTLPDHGTLTLKLPDGWNAELQHPNRLPVTLSLKPGQGAMFEVLITAVWQVSPTAGLTDELTLRSEVAAAAKNAEPESVEGSLPLKELTGTEGRGFYFFATDRAPKPGEYKYMTQGILRTGMIGLAFTVLTNDGQEAVRSAALKVLQSAAHHPEGAL